MNTRNNIILTILFTMLLLGASGCGSDANEDPSISGSWVGTTTVQGSTFTIDIQLNDNSGSVNGNGTLVFIEPIAVNATGTYNFPNLSMTIRSSGFRDLNFNGTLSADGNSLTGSLRGSDFDNFSITLRRQ